MPQANLNEAAVTPVSGMFGNKTNADLATLLSDGTTLTPAGQGLADALPALIQKYTATGAIDHYRANVIDSTNFSPAGYFAAFVNYAADLWELFQDNLRSATPTQESIISESGRLTSNGQLTEVGQYFIGWVNEAIHNIANYANTAPATKAAAKHYRQYVINNRLPVVHYIAQYPQQIDTLKSVFVGYLKAGGELPAPQPVTAPAPQSRKPLVYPGGSRLTPLGEATVKILHENYRAGKMKVLPATRAYVTYVEQWHQTPAQFFAENHSTANSLQDYAVLALMDEIDELGAEIKAIKQAGVN